MDIERERGITIKSQSVRMPWVYHSEQGAPSPESDERENGAVVGQEYCLNMIDTPGHVDFTYEVSRSLAACEGCILLVDAAQGIEAQTLANLYIALENDLTVIPVLNKIDLPAADPDKHARELANLIGCDTSEVLRVSGKTGAGVKELLDVIVEKIPPATVALKKFSKSDLEDVGVDILDRGNSPDLGVIAANLGAKALIFDSVYDVFRGVVTYIRVVQGALRLREKIKMMSSGATHELLEIGVISPEPMPAKSLSVGEVGYLITGVKNVADSKVGDTVTTVVHSAVHPLAGYKEPKPMVYSGLYPIEQGDYPALRDALDKLKLNDAALLYEPETSVALGFGFRVGFLGLLHLEIVRERLEREFDLALVSTTPNVIYNVTIEDGTEFVVTNPSEFPSGQKIMKVEEPIVRASILSPKEFVGTIMELCQMRRGDMIKMDYLSEDRVEMRYHIPLAEIVFDFFDSLKSRTKGYASLDYEPSGVRESELVKVDILLNHEPVDAFSAIVHRDKAYDYGVMMTEKLKELIPRQQFEIPIQAAVGTRVIARESIRALRKDVTAKCYGGDITRKRKLLEKQKEGKKRMKTIGRVEVPPDAFIAALKTN
jgi:GTP-binding protein LepA